MTCDSGRHSKSGDAKQAPSEGCQSGGEAVSPVTHSNPTNHNKATDAMIEFVAEALANQIGMRKGCPPIRGCLRLMPADMATIFRDDARAAITTLEAARQTTSGGEGEPLGDGTDFGVTGEWWGTEDATCPVCETRMRVIAKGGPDDLVRCKCTIVSLEWLRLATLAALAKPVTEANGLLIEEVATEQAALDEFLDEYELCGDAGYYTPNEFEASLIEDALQGWLADRTRRMADIRSRPPSLSERGERG